MNPSQGKLVLTRPRQQAGEWGQRLADLGVDACGLPLIEIVPGDGREAQAAWLALESAALAVFVSPNAVENFFEHRPEPQAWPAKALAACVGPGSARALAAAGVPVELIVQPPADSSSLDSEHLWPQLAGRDWRGRKVLLLRGHGGRDWLAERLREQGALTSYFSVYRRSSPAFDPGELALFAQVLAAPREHVWLFSSAEGVEHLRGLAPAGHDWSAARCICTHERIAAAASSLGLAHVVLARPDAQAVARAFKDMQDGDLQSISL